MTQAPRSVQVGEPYSIPTGYGDDRIVLMVKDPWWLYAYWEIQAEKERDARSRLLPQEIAGLRSVLRVYDVTDVEFPSRPAHQWFDITLSGLANNWYIETNAPDRAFIVDIGLLTQGGRFLPLARSNRIRTPRFGPSEIIDETWATTEEVYWKLFGAATPGFGSSPTSWARGLSHQVFSGAWSSPGAWSANRPALRGFWCWVRTDLIVYGATEPKATVTIQGQPVDVRKDGTFSLRLALPEGIQTLAVEARSADGRFAKTITPIVTLGWEGGSPDTPPHGPPRSRVAFETREQVSDGA